MSERRFIDGTYFGPTIQLLNERGKHINNDQNDNFRLSNTNPEKTGGGKYRANFLLIFSGEAHARGMLHGNKETGW